LKILGVDSISSWERYKPCKKCWQTYHVCLSISNGMLDHHTICRFGLGLWCLTPHSTIVQLYRGGQL